MNDKVLVSVIVPCYNQGIFLDECLASVYFQTFKNWECIIVNDGSTDDTDATARKWVEKDKRFKLLSQNNSGVCVARNNGIGRSKGTFILPLDGDDKISNDFLRLGISAFNSNSNLKLVYSKVLLFGSRNGVWELPEFSLKNLAMNNMIVCTAFYRRTDFDKLGGYDLNMLDGLEDWEFWISLLKDSGEVYQIPKVCFFYRMKNNSRQVNILPKEYKQLYAYLSKKHTTFFIDNLGSFQDLSKKIVVLERKNRELQSKFINRLSKISDLFLKKIYSYKKNRFESRK